MPPHAPLRRSMNLAVVAGCLYMVFATCTASPLLTEFFRALGATEAVFGLIAAIPSFMIAFQFVGALLAARSAHRRVLFMGTLIASRLLYLPLALLPLTWPAGTPGLLPVLLLLLALSTALANIGGPLFPAWMADLIPARVLGRFWGQRQRLMHVTWVASFLAVAGYAAWRLPPVPAYALLCAAGILPGVADIVLFAWIREPAASPAPARSISLLLEPVRHPDFRRFLLFTCLWSGVTMFGSSFMQLHTLQNLHVSVGMTTLIWSTVGVGMALSSRWWGHQVDRFGQRPVLKVCIAFKPLVALVFVLVTPRTAPWVLPLVFAVDAVWNAGILVASNGYMLKSSPRQNRSMYVAAFSGLAAICGGLGSLAGGALLHLYSDFSLAFAGRVWSNYHLLFFVNTLMRVACYPMLSHIREPASRSMEEAVLGMQATWPMRLLLFPLDLYRRLDAGWDSMWRRGPGA